jgi:hypothetical protein
VVGATVLILSGSAGNNDGTTDGGAVGLGIVLLFLGGPTLLVGVIAVGVRLGLRDDAASLPRRTRDSYSRSGEAAFPDIRSRLLHGKAVSRLGT